MKPQEIKDQITLEDIGSMLESLGCEQVRIHGNVLSSTKGNGSDNPSGIVIWENGNFFNAEMYTTPEFDQYMVKDVFSVIRQLTGRTFDQAVEFVGNFVDLENTEKETKAPTISDWLDKIEKKGVQKEKESWVYDPSFLDQFPRFLHPYWKQEGITEETAEKFDIRFDQSTECIMIPIYDKEGRLVGVKVRETRLAKNKYSYALRTRKSVVLYGLWQNEEAIRKEKEVIVFEAEKSVLKADSLGIHNTVAIGGKILSADQVRLLNSLNASVVLALDEDVSEEDIMRNVHKITFPFPVNDVYVLRDNRLNPKESPADRPEIMMDYKNHREKVGEKE